METKEVVALLKSLLIEFNKKVYLGDMGKLYYEQSDVHTIIMDKIKEVEDGLPEVQS